MVEVKSIPLAKLVGNTGQIPGLPKNPRVCKDAKYKALVQSIRDHPEMLELRELIVYPLNGKFVVIAGNMRLRGMRDEKFEEAPCKVLKKNTPPEKMAAYAIKDNVPFGETDFDVLANEWTEFPLADWGQDVPTGKEAKEINVPDGFTLEVKVKDEVSCRELFEELKERGLSCRILAF